MLYSILNIIELNNVNYNEVDQTSAQTVRKNVDETEFIISFPSDNIPEIASESTKYTHNEMYSFVEDSSNGWIPED
jgi:hypothetical protein